MCWRWPPSCCRWRWPRWTRRSPTPRCPPWPESLHVSAAQVIWVVNAYQLATIAAALPFAASGEVLGHGRVFAAGTLVFTFASLACGLADSLHHAGGRAHHPGPERRGHHERQHRADPLRVPGGASLGRGVGMNSLVVALAFTVGPTVASAVLSVASWHWLFLINVPVGHRRGGVRLARAAVIPSARATASTAWPRCCAPGLFGCRRCSASSRWRTAAEWPCRWCVEWAVAAICGTLLLLRRQAGHPAPMLAIDLFKDAQLHVVGAHLDLLVLPPRASASSRCRSCCSPRSATARCNTGLLMTPWPADRGRHGA